MAFFDMSSRRKKSLINHVQRYARLTAFLLPAALSLPFLFAAPARAQSLALITDDQTQHMLESYETPFLKAAGLDPKAVKLYIVNDATVNSFAAEGQNIFIQTGMIMYLDKPNELKGVMAHETGHVAGGDLTRDRAVIAKATIPMLASLALGVAAMIAGAGNAGMAIISGGMQVAQGTFTSFSRTQEATADQRGMKYLNASHQSGRGMLRTFERFADEEAMSAERIDTFARDHPASRDRVTALESLVEASPYKDVTDTSAEQHEFDMVKAKLTGFTAPVESVFNKYPLSDTSQPARYARAIVYMRKPDLKLALVEINSLIQEEPSNPYFHQVLGQIQVNMARPDLGVASFQKAADLLPDGDEIRVELAGAQLATEKAPLAQHALDNLKIALQKDNDNVFAWYEVAQAYSLMGNETMASLSTAERFYAIGAYPQATHFARQAQKGLKEGSADWQRANDIMAASTTEAQKH